MPGRIRFDLGGDWITPRVTMNTFDAEASVSFPSRNRIVSAAPTSAETWRRRQLPMREIDLMSQRSQRLSCALTQGEPFSTSSRGGLTRGFDIMKTVGSTPFGKA